VNFTEGARPKNLPGGMSIFQPFDARDGFSAGAKAPAPKTGINPGEYLGIYFDLKNGSSYFDVIDALSAGELRIGIHAQAFENCGSESFINIPSATVPLPASLLFLGSGIISLFLTKLKN
jgi:hypothetical protein